MNLQMGSEDQGRNENQLIQEWSSFFSACAKLQPQDLTTTWGNFFDAFKGVGTVERGVTEYKTNPAKMKSFFRDFEEVYGQFYRSGAAISVWDVAGLGGDEVRVCSVLAWLLDRHGSHGQGDGFLSVFLNGFRGENRSVLPSEQCIARGYRTSVESSYDMYLEGAQKQSASRVDIEISGPDILLFIEAKIYAPETDNQLERYINVLRSTASARSTALIFLTPTGRLPKSDYVSKQIEVVPLSWKKISQKFLRYINDSMCKKSLSYALIKQFCDHINRF